MPKPPAEPRVRITLDLSKRQYQNLDELQEKLDLTSKAEVCRRAILFYELLQAKLADGSKLVMEKDGVREQILLVGSLG